MTAPDALCAQVLAPGYDPFFAPEGEQPAARRVRENEAIAICRMCPVLDTCRRLADADPGLREFSVIAGLRPKNRRQVRGIRRTYSDQERQEIRAAYVAGVPTAQIARNHAMHTSTVSYMCADVRHERIANLGRTTA